MRKLTIIILLLTHINFNMFCPLIMDDTTYSIAGNNTNEINSLAELIQVTVNGNTIKDSFPEAENHTNNLFFHAKPGTFVYINFHSLQPQLSTTLVASAQKMKYPLSLATTLMNTVLEVQTPPPNYTHA